jgi:alkylation response protein AidB-like acyl-CoA dehydrogenase
VQGKVRGCFALTELGLGVLSGSTVRTRLLDAPGGGFLLDNYDDAAAAKVWISCGDKHRVAICNVRHTPPPPPPPLRRLQPLTPSWSLPSSSLSTNRSA